MTQSRALGAALLLLACSEGGGPHDSTPEMPSGVVQGNAACGAEGESCCSPPLPECGLGLACDSAANACAPAQFPTQSSALCRSSNDCPAGYTCCLAGVLGSCEALAPAACPLPDLVLVRSAYNGPSLRTVDAASEPCAAELGCFTADGTRTSLGFLPDVLNVGTADLLLGDPRAANGLRRLECIDPRYPAYTYVELFRYALLDPAGLEVAHGSQSVTLECDEQVGYRFRHDFCGIQRTQGAASLDDLPYDLTFCGGIDVTDVSPGLYTLRVTVNADRIWPESDYENDSLNIPVELSRDAPTEPCGDPAFEQLRGDECGWQLGPQATCLPGEVVAVACAECRQTPQLRVCEGARACSAEQALYELAGCSPAFFICPDSGSYSVLTKPYDSGLPSPGFTADLACELQRISFDPLAVCSTPVLGVGATRECGWTPALSVECEPGQTISLACPECDRKPMLRVCDGAGACSHVTELASFEDPAHPGDYQSGTFGECPELDFTCPESGHYTALLASYWENEPYGCDLVSAELEPEDVPATPPTPPAAP